MRVSAVICAYNHALFVGDTIRSVLEQTRPADEVLVLDDGSSDETVAVARRFEPQVRVLPCRHEGVVAARNRAVSETSGDLVAIIDSDDLVEPGRFARQVPVFQEHAAVGVAYGDCWVIGAAGGRLGRFWDLYPPPRGGHEAVELFATHCFVPANSVMFRRSSFEATGPLWGPGPHADYLKWIEMGLCSAIYRDSGPPLSSWRRHAEQTSRGDARRQEAYYLELKRALARLWRRSPSLRAMLPPRRAAARLARCHFMVALHAAREGERSLAVRHFRRAARLAPAEPLVLAGRIAAARTVRPVAMPLIGRVAERRLGRWD